MNGSGMRVVCFNVSNIRVLDVSIDMYRVLKKMVSS